MVENQICLGFMLSHVLSCTKISNKVITNNFISNNFITNNIITFLSRYHTNNSGCNPWVESSLKRIF